MPPCIILSRLPLPSRPLYQITTNTSVSRISAVSGSNFQFASDIRISNQRLNPKFEHQQLQEASSETTIQVPFLAWVVSLTTIRISIAIEYNLYQHNPTSLPEPHSRKLSGKILRTTLATLNPYLTPSILISNEPHSSSDIENHHPKPTHLALTDAEL
jgi:hypothetical protein